MRHLPVALVGRLDPTTLGGGGEFHLFLLPSFAARVPVTAPHSSDSQLMDRVARGEVAAFRELSSAYLGAIVTYAFRLLGNHAEAEEVAQEVFLRAWQKSDSYQPTARVSTWLHSIAHNLAIDSLRKRRGGHAELDDERDEAPPSQNPAELLERKMESGNVMAALLLLPERQRVALLLSHEQGLSNPEIAEVLGAHVEAVESLLSRGRKKLRELLRTEARNAS